MCVFRFHYSSMYSINKFNDIIITNYMNNKNEYDLEFFVFILEKWEKTILRHFQLKKNTEHSKTVSAVKSMWPYMLTTRIEYCFNNGIRLQ